MGRAVSWDQYLRLRARPGTHHRANCGGPGEEASGSEHEGCGVPSPRGKRSPGRGAPGIRPLAILSLPGAPACGAGPLLVRRENADGGPGRGRREACHPGLGRRSAGRRPLKSAPRWQGRCRREGALVMLMWGGPPAGPALRASSVKGRVGRGGGAGWDPTQSL